MRCSTSRARFQHDGNNAQTRGTTKSCHKSRRAHSGHIIVTAAVTPVRKRETRHARRFCGGLQCRAAAACTLGRATLPRAASPQRAVSSWRQESLGALWGPRAARGLQREAAHLAFAARRSHLRGRTARRNPLCLSTSLPLYLSTVGLHPRARRHPPRHQGRKERSLLTR